MSSSAPDLRDEVAAVLAEHASDGWGECVCSEYVLEVPYAQHLADALLASPALARVIREAKAEAWDEGAAKGAEVGMDAIDLNPMHANPYREEQS